MMILRSSPTSPFGRKVKLAAAILGLSGAMRIEVADTMDAADSLRSQNPLGKIPTLILEDGGVLYDSRVILDYLDERAGGGRIMPRGPGRFAVLTRQALADGVVDAGVLLIYEQRFRDEPMRSPRWIGHQQGKIERGVEAFEAMIAPFDPARMPDVADIALAAMLGYLDFRFEGAWRRACPKLVAWLDGFAAAVPAFEATRPRL